MHALTHFRAGHRKPDRAVGRDLDPAVECHFADADRQVACEAGAAARRQQAPADEQRAGGGEAAQEQRTSSHDCGGGLRRGGAAGRVGAALPSARSAAAADLIATRMRG